MLGILAHVVPELTGKFSVYLLPQCLIIFHHKSQVKLSVEAGRRGRLA